MFRRAFWFTAGAAAGVWATNKAHRKLRQLTPRASPPRPPTRPSRRATGSRDFALDVRAGMLQREAELEQALGIDAPADALPAPRRSALGPAPAAAPPPTETAPTPPTRTTGMRTTDGVG